MQANFKNTVAAIILGSVSLAVAIPALAQSQDTAPPAAGAQTQGPMAAFAEFDTDGDGKVTEAEFAAGRAAAAAELDSNADGKISEEELVAQELKKAQARIEARVKARIAAQDSDGDGMLSAAELATRQMPERMFSRMDANGDGAVSAEEMQARRDTMRGQGRGNKGERPGREQMGHRGGDRSNCGGMQSRGWN